MKKLNLLAFAAVVAGLVLGYSSVTFAQVSGPVLWKQLGTAVSTVNAVWRAGVGTSTPNAKLTVQGTSGSTMDLFNVATSTGASLFKVDYLGNLTFAGTCASCGGLSGGTDGMLAAWTGSDTLAATSSPTAARFIATSTTLASQLQLASTTLFSNSGASWLSTTTFSGNVALIDGTEDLPAIYFASEPELGFHRQSSGVLDVNVPSQFRVHVGGGAAVFDFQSGAFLPAPDGTVNLGGTSNYWKNFYTTWASTTALTASGAVFISDGSVTNPAVTFASDPDTGIYRNTTNTIAISGGGAGFSWDGVTLYPNTTNARAIGKTGNVWNSILANFASTTALTTSGSLWSDGYLRAATTSIGNSGVASASSTAITDRNRTFYVDGSVAVKECTLTDGATVTWDLSQCSYARIVQGGNRTLDITNQGQAIGQSVRLVVCSDGTGRTLTWDTDIIMWPGGTPPTQTATANQCDVVAGFVTAATGTAKIFLGSALAF